MQKLESFSRPNISQAFQPKNLKPGDLTLSTLKKQGDFTKTFSELTISEGHILQGLKGSALSQMFLLFSHYH